jgi:hypothetical protein
MLSHRSSPLAEHFYDVVSDDQGVAYTAGPHATAAAAEYDALAWERWADSVPTGAAESIYYILAVPLIWPGPPPGAHRYSGLQFKIGRTCNVLTRLQNLRTGTSEELILHALQPGDAVAEAALHELFKEERWQGEWFAASPRLCAHVMATWRKYRILPPEHQQRLLRFAKRSSIYAGLRGGGYSFDMINPSINEPWHGSVLVDLVYTSLLRSGESEE